MTDSTYYLDALRELERRRGKGLEFDKSFEIIRQAARERRFLSYKELADASGANWAQVHYTIGRHLWNLVEYAHCRKWPMLSAIVVNKPNVSTGAMDPETLKGFIAAASQLGCEVIDESAFLKDQQERVFAWAQVGISSTPEVRSVTLRVLDARRTRRPAGNVRTIQNRAANCR